MGNEAAAIPTLVDFVRPPVVEVALGVQFSEHVVDLEVLADLAKAWRDRYPTRQQHEPLPPISESFERPALGPALHFRLGPALPRTWFVTPDERELLQVQADRIILNWRRVAAEDEYPRYRTLRPRLEAALDDLCGVLREMGRPEPDADVVEVTYVNELSAPSESDKRHPSLELMLRPLQGFERSFLPEAEDAAFAARYRFDRDGIPAGRLNVRTESAFRSADARPIYVLNLTANVVAASRNLVAVTELLDEGREWVVKGFDDLTTNEMHDYWNRDGAS